MGIEANDERAPRGHALGPAFLAAARSTIAGIQERGTGLLVASLMAAAALSRLADTIHHDVAWYIYTAGVVLDGGRLYEDVFFEMNPPLMVYLTVPGVILARLSGLFPVHAYVLTVFAVIAISLWLSMHIRPPAHRQISLVFWFLVLAVLPAGGFGQRGHLMLCLTLPYLLLIAGRLHREEAACGRALAIAVGAIAGIGFAIKPYFLLVPTALEVLLLWRTRGRVAPLRPETLALGTVVTLYAFAIAIFTPLYLTRAVPYALEAYNAYNNSLGFVLSQPQTLLLPVLVLVHCRTRSALAPPQAVMADVFSLSAATLYATYVMQMKGWGQHLYPATAMLAMLAGTIVTGSSVTVGPLRIVVLAAGYAFLTKDAVMSDNRYPLMDRLMPLVREHAADGSIFFFSSQVRAGFPMTVYAGVEWASRFPALWLLPALERRRHAAATEVDLEILDEIERFTTDAVIADLSAQQPEVVFVDARPRKPYYGDLDFDYIAHFSADARFAALWARYERIAEVDGFEVYRLRSDEVSKSTT